MADFIGPSCMLLIIVSSLTMFAPEHLIILAEAGPAANANRETNAANDASFFIQAP